MDSIVKTKQTLWKRYERERASQSNNYEKKTDIEGFWRDHIHIPEIDLTIQLEIDTTKKKKKYYRWNIWHPTCTVYTWYPSPNGTGYIKVKNMKNRDTLLSLVGAIESAFGIQTQTHNQNGDENASVARALLNTFHKNKLANTKIPRNVKQLFGRANNNNNNNNNAPPLGLDLFSPEANAVIDALEKTTHANTAVPEYWVRYHGGLYASETMYYRFKVPKDVVIITFTYPGCPNFWLENNNWEAKGHMNAYCGNLERIPKISSCNRKGQPPIFVPYVSGDVMPDIHLSTQDEKNKKMGLYRRRHENGKFMPVDLETPEIWLRDLVKKHGPGIYYVSSCQSVVNESNLNKIHLVENLRNLALHAEKARKRKYAQDNYYSNVHDVYGKFFNRHIDLLKKKNPTPDDIIRMRKALMYTGMKIYRRDFTKKHMEMAWNRLHG